VDIIQLLLKVYPKAASHQDARGTTPLYHVSCAIARDGGNPNSIAIMQVILEECPQAARLYDVYHSYPLHCLVSCGCGVYSTQALISLLRVAPDVALTRNECGKTALCVLLEQSAKQQHVSSVLDDYVNCTEWIFSSSMFCTIEKRRRLLSLASPRSEEWWRQLNLLLCATHHAAVVVIAQNDYDDDDNSSTKLFRLDDDILDKSMSCRTLHRLAALLDAVDWSLVKLAVEKYPEQLKETDEFGNLPLHIVLHASIAVSEESSKSSVAYSCAKCAWGCKCGDRNNNNFMEGGFITTCDQNYYVDELLSAWPGAAQVPTSDGRYPLHMAIESGMVNCSDIETILSAHPDALRLPDSRTQMYPFMLAALHSSSSRCSCICTNDRYASLTELSVKCSRSISRSRERLGLTFDLLRACPETGFAV